MNLQTLSDQDLLHRTRELVQRERELLTEVLNHLREVERRRLFSDLGCSSLFDYATRELGYSEDQAYRRITAMRLLKELPEVEDKISEGSLTLSVLSVAGSLFKAEAKHCQPLSAPPRNSAAKRPAIPTHIKRLVWRRDDGRCGGCGSTHGLEFDHKLPLALGGTNTTDNLRLLCRPCNQRAAILTIGAKTMNRYIEKTTVPGPEPQFG